MDLTGFIVMWLFVGCFVSIGLHAKDNAEYPVDADTIGQMILAPLFVAKWVATGVLWLLANLLGSLVLAAKKLIGIN